MALPKMIISMYSKGSFVFLVSIYIFRFSGAIFPLDKIYSFQLPEICDFYR